MKKIVVLILSLALLFTFTSIDSFAFADDSEDYIEIWTVDDLYNVRNDLSSNYKLMCDLDMSETRDPDSIYNYYGCGWDPIGSDGNYCSQDAFTGTFDGNGHKITNLYINLTTLPKSDKRAGYVALFMENKGIIKNLHIVDSSIYSNVANYHSMAAPFVCINYGIISCCSFDGTCEGGSCASGIAAHCYDENAKISECYNKGTILSNTVDGYAGALCGMASNVGNAYIENCYNTGTINARYSIKVGFEGTNKKSIINSYYIQMTNEGISGVYYDGSDINGISLTESQLQKQQYFTGFDFENVWTIETATDYKYPQLRNNMMDTAKHVDIIEWKTQPTKIDYYTDEDIDPAGGVFTAYYIDDTHEDIEVTKDMLSGYDMTQTGVQTVTVTFREGTLAYDILTSTRPEVKSLTLETMPYKTEFARGTKFDFTGATARVEYVNGKIEIIPITAEETTGGNIEQSGTYTITFEKYGKSITFEVKVVPVKPIGINIVTPPDKTTYLEGQSVDFTGMVVRLEYNNGKTETITDYTVGEYDNTVGSKTITISYENFTTSFEVEFLEKSLTGIMVTTQPTRAKYVAGEQFDPTGMVVKAVYDNGFSEEITDYTVTQMTEALGWQTLTVSYNGKTASVKVYVEEKNLVSIAVSELPTKTTYVEGEAFDSTGMVVLANYNDVYTEEIKDYTVSANTNKVGENTVTILYEGKTASFKITVVEKTLLRIEVTKPEKTEYIAGEEFDPAGMVVKAVYDNGKKEEITDYTVSGFGDAEETNIVTIDYKGKTSAFVVVIHTPESKWTITSVPTCTEDGSQELYCANCGKLLKSETVQALGHSWGEWQTISSANCTDKGSRKHICSVCGIEEFEEIDPLGHKWETEYRADKEATCTEEGSESIHCSVCGAIETGTSRTIAKLPHELTEWITIKEATCSEVGQNQRHCENCDYIETEEIPTISHSYKITTTKATLTKNGSIVKKCTVCGKVASTTTIYYPKTIKLSAAAYTYDGKVKTPTVTVKDSKGNTISSTNYTVTKATGRKNVGSYKYTIKFKGNYSGTKTLTFKINPKGTTLKTLTATSKGFKATWTKQATKMSTSYITGYEIQYSTSSTFASGNKTVIATKYSTVSKTISKLTAKKKYYVRIRTYKTVSGVKYYSPWSAKKYVTTKA